ncbi:hypothetical protein BC940DRAFT_272721 [Gongronella butleri]|nr:hypothetical protein BC940DRAFT_272721 [Gongronella butleri]
MPSPPSLSPASTHPSVVQDGCRQPLADHVLCFSHGARRIQVYFVTMPASAMVRPEMPTLTPLTTPPATPKAAAGGKQAKQEKQAKQTRLCFWMACTSCDARTPPTWVSSATRRFSFGKYIELFLYSQRFTSVPAFCPHTRTPDNARHHIACCFGVLPDDDAPGSTDALEIRFVSEAINVYALKGPPLQAVLPSAASGASNSSHSDASFNHASLSLRVHESVLQRWYRAEEHALDGFFRQLRDHVLKLQEQYHVARHDTTRWLATFDQQHTHLTRTLTQHQQQHTALNEFRRLFTTVATELVQDYRQWHHAQPWAAQTRQKVKDAANDNNEKTESDTDTFQWRDAPDYATPLADANTKGIHCFPNSSIVVREAEPTSIIAYTLSCMDYVAELVSESTRSDVSTSVPATPPLPPLKDSQDERISAIHRDKDVPPRPPAKSYGTSSTTTRSSSGQATDEQPQVLDEYFSTIERKFIAPSLGSATETASFRTMVMETVRNNVSDVQQSRRLTRMKRKWHRMARLAEDEPQNGHESMASTSFSQPASAASLAVPAAPQQYVLSDTTSEFQGTFVQPMAADVTQPVSPHILHRFAHGNVEFTCTVYYAHEFEHVRRLCGVQQLMIESLARCQSWTATGGKSKSQFYKTQDDRMVVKEMVNAWNIAEKDAFLRFAPKYFQYIKETAQSPSILAKIFGFYSLQMRTVDDKRVLLDMDLLVMEQLFYGHKITRTFDFKGIPDRQLDEEKRQRADVTLWDGDWRQGYRISYAVNGQSKAWMASAITRDTEFLAHGNIMDYSLLVGVDASTNELVIGIVDFIGAYTWYKKIESKSKSTIQRHREVTVLPPDQYRARFCKQILNYFIPIPGIKKKKASGSSSFDFSMHSFFVRQIRQDSHGAHTNQPMAEMKPSPHFHSISF